MNGPEESVELDLTRVLAIVQEDAPQAFELAVRRHIIERQREVIAQLHAALQLQDDVLA